MFNDPFVSGVFYSVFFRILFEIAFLSGKMLRESFITFRIVSFIRRMYKRARDRHKDKH